MLKVVLKGSIGTRSLDVVPPNPGTAGTVVLSINNGGDRFCGSFGGVAGGTVDPNSASAFKIRNPTGQPPCPPDPPQLCCDFPFMQQCAWADNAEECVYFGGNPGDGNSVCDSVTGLCTTPPAQEGYCCGNLPTVFGTNCGAGPTLSPLCTDLGGTLFSSAVCTPAGTCASPSGAFVDSAAEPF